jgi:eukaryotic-like serine/threonine-protein kinase
MRLQMERQPLANACLNPYVHHPAPSTSQPHIVCAEPNCGFLLAGAPIDHCRIATLLGRGSIADLYLATAVDPATSTPPRMLVKVLRTPIAAPLPQLEQGLDQLLSLRHPHVHPLQGVGWTGQGGTLYLLSRYEEQGSLSATAAAAPRLPPLAVASIVRQIAEGLQFAHERHMVHGRLKPENCLLVAPATVQVSDFYRILLPLEARAPSPSYAAPEQALGQADLASDQYALAILTYQLLSQSLPFSGSGVTDLAANQVQSGAPLGRTLRPDLPPQVDQTLRRALSLQARDRFPSILTFAADLQAALEGSGSTDPFAFRSAATFSPSTRHSTDIPSSGRPIASTPRSLASVCLLPGHTSAITLLRWAPDGQLLASAGADQSVRLWRLQKRIGAPVNTLTGHSGEVLALRWSSNGQYLASGANDGTVYLWNTSSITSVAPRPQAAWWAHDGNVTDIDWSPTSRQIATAGSDRTIRLWDTAGNARAAWQAHGRGGVSALAWSPDGHALASGGVDRQILLWNSDTGAQTLVCDGQGDEIRHLAWSPSSAVVASAGKKDPRVCLWDAQTGEQLSTLTGHTREIVGLFWSSDGSWLATAAADRTLRFWSTQRLSDGMLGQPLQLGSQPLSMAGTVPSGLVALGQSDMQIQILQLSS